MSLSSPRPWNLVAAGYAEHNVAVFEGFARDALSLSGFEPSHRVLDVATGPGSLALLAAGGGAQVHALDFSEAMLAQLDRRAGELGWSVVAQQGDGQALPYADASFDRAYSMFGLMFFPDRAAGFRELYRVLRPGGCAVVSSWHPMDDVPLFPALFGAIFAEAPQLAPPEDAPAESAPMPLTRRADFEEELVAAGFEAEIVTRVHAMRAESLTDYLRGTRAAFAPVCLMEEAVGTEAFDAIWAGVTARLIAQLGDGPVRIEMPAWLGLGHKR